MRIFHVRNEGFVELPGLPDALPTTGFLWIGSSREEFDRRVNETQASLHRWTLGPLVDLHVSDLLNPQLPSHYEDTSWYDVLVFRRLGAAAATASAPSTPADLDLGALSVDTSPVGFAVYDRVLITVHPAGCSVRDYFAQRLTAMAGGSEARGSARLPSSPADLMLRMVNHMVDSYLDLRRLLTKQFAQLQQQLLAPNSRFRNWGQLLDARTTLHVLEDTCEDQRAAVQEWIDALDEWPDEPEHEKRRERELLRLRSRDVLEHIERVLAHVRRLEHSAETSVQMYFSALGHRTNDIMRTLTVLTAVFLPLNLITGFFGMNFDGLPLIHNPRGFWAAVAVMAAIAAGFIIYFRRQRFIEGDGR